MSRPIVEESVVISSSDVPTPKTKADGPPPSIALRARRRLFGPSESIAETSEEDFGPGASPEKSKMLEEYERPSPSKPSSTPRRKRRRESILQWFDRSCERELTKRQIEGHFDSLDVSNIRGLDRPEMTEATTSGIDIAGMLGTQQTTELTEACEKLAKAQAMDIFKGAVRAAEEAAANAPPEYAEEAAAAGARDYQAELTSVIQENIPGTKPMEVIGYVGVTRPRRPIRR